MRKADLQRSPIDRVPQVLGQTQQFAAEAGLLFTSDILAGISWHVKSILYIVLA